MTFHMWCGSIVTLLLRGRRSIWWGWREILMHFWMCSITLPSSTDVNSFRKRLWRSNESTHFTEYLEGVSGIAIQHIRWRLQSSKHVSERAGGWFFSIGPSVLIGLCFFYRVETSAPGLSGYYWYIYIYFSAITMQSHFFPELNHVEHPPRDFCFHQRFDGSYGSTRTWGMIWLGNGREHERRQPDDRCRSRGSWRVSGWWKVIDHKFHKDFWFYLPGTPWVLPFQSGFKKARN